MNRETLDLSIRYWTFAHARTIDLDDNDTYSYRVFELIKIFPEDVQLSMNDTIGYETLQSVKINENLIKCYQLSGK